MSTYANSSSSAAVMSTTANPILRDSMLALHEVLSDLEVDLENTKVAAEICPSRRQRRGLETLAARYESQLNALRQFFDWDVVNEQQVAA